VIKVRFIHDGKAKGWRYGQGEEVLLPDGLAQLAIKEGMAIDITQARPQHSVSRGAYHSIAEAKERSLK
jgi:hypothetical protein